MKATLRTNRSRLLVGLDIAQAVHMAHLRHAHTRVVVPTLTIPNSTRGFAQLWVRIQQAQQATGCREVVCGLEPSGTYHQAVANYFICTICRCQREKWHASFGAKDARYFIIGTEGKPSS